MPSHFQEPGRHTGPGIGVPAHEPFLMKRPNNQVFDRIRRWIDEGVDGIGVFGASGAAVSYLLSRVLSPLKRPCVILAPSDSDAERLVRELRFFMAGGRNEGRSHLERLFSFPGYDISPLSGLSPHQEIVTRRIESLFALTAGDHAVVVSSLEASCHRILPKEALVRSLEYLETDEDVDREALIRTLETLGYHRTSIVEERGDYAVRGGIIDLFPPLSPEPVRLEFWGDHLESIRSFDPLSQRSRNVLEETVILPACEIIMTKRNVARARSMGRLPAGPDQGMDFPGKEAWLNHFYGRTDTLFGYLPENGLLVVIDPHRVDAVAERVEAKFLRETDKFREEAAERGVPFPETQGLLLDVRELREHLTSRRRLDVGPLNLAPEGVYEKQVVLKETLVPGRDLELDVRTERKGRVSLAPLAERISGWIAGGGRVVVVSRTEQQAGRLSEILENYHVPVGSAVTGWRDVPEAPGLTICIGRLSRGFAWPELKLYVISEDEIFGPKRGRRTVKKPGRPGIAWSAFSQLQEGDLVVHEEHGIGRYRGLVKMEIARMVNDFVIVEYANNDRLYIPADRVSVLQKYIGADAHNPKLDQLGGRSWNLAKKNAKKSVKAIARQLIELYALRASRKGFAYSPPDNYFREFETTFEHEETPDQIKAIEDTLEDMSSEKPMDRLVCGDVGFGKTEVALRATFKAVSDGKQVAMLVPTTVLAEQHFETFSARMKPYPYRVGIVSRFKSRAEQTETLARVRAGKIHILIGTHRLLQKDVRFKNLGLLIIDEEQRFGVKQKEKLKKYRALVDVLALTATPIPRTLQMAMMGVRDLSIIETPPEDRLAIQTYLSPFDESTVRRAILAELERGGQVFFVHNRVRTIEQMASRLRDLVPEARLAVAHGQLKERELEEAMIRFLRKEVDVLVCSTIIESGLDIPSANTIVINEVDRLGLSQIYQLRGRVGRSKEKAYAYLLLSRHSRLTRDAEKRLKALMDFTTLGAGLHLALHDLRIRGGGNVLGYAQSGQIAAVGYELYVKLIEQAVAELKGEEWHEEVNPEIHVDVPAFLPEGYVMDADVRLNLYRRLSTLSDEAELPGMREEIKDRFGPFPREVENLLEVMALRLLLKKLGIRRMDVGPSRITLTYPQDGRMDPGGLLDHIAGHPHRYSFAAHNKLAVKVGKIVLPEHFGKIREALLELGAARTPVFDASLGKAEGSASRK